MGNVDCKLIHYADDTTVILDGSQASLERSFALLDNFGQLSGLRVNCGKTKVLWIGSKKGSNQIMSPKKNLKWADGKVKALGVWFYTDQNEEMKMNYEDKFHKVEDILNNWQNKRLTLPGKITVTKTLAASQLVNILSSLRTCFKSLKEINDFLFKFLWNGKRDKIKLSEMIADYGDGGQKMSDIMAFNKSLKIAWIVKYISDDCKSKWDFGISFFQKMGRKISFSWELVKQKTLGNENLLRKGSSFFRFNSFDTSLTRFGYL